MSQPRIAISLGSGYFPGLAGVVCACARAIEARGWEAVGIRDGLDGLLFPERYPLGGVIAIDAEGSEDVDSLLGTGARSDPFRVQRENVEGFIEEIDASDEVLASLRARGITSMIALVGGSAVTGSHALSVMWKLARKDLPCVCIPKSAENDLAATARPFGYDSVLAFTSQCLRHARAAARDQRRVAVVEVPGQYAGWLALEAGQAAGADVILLPEIAYQADLVAAHLATHPDAALIVVAKGARSVAQVGTLSDAADVARQTYETLQRRTTRELFPLTLDQWARAGGVSDADCALGNAYASEAVRFLAEGHNQHLIAAGDDGFTAIPLTMAVNCLRTLDAQAPAVHLALTRGICLGFKP